MFKKIIPVFLTALMVGFMACGGSSQLVDKAQTNITNQKYDAALSAADSLIQKKPNNPIGYYYKGVALGQKGQAQEPPSEGTTFFKQMNEAFQKAKELASQAEKVPEEVNRIQSVQKSFWQVAHNKGVKLIQNDSLSATFQNPTQRSLAFLHNAVIIQPTHPVTYQAIAIVSGRAGKYKEAAEAQKQFINMADSVSARNYLVLAQYYRRADMAEESVQMLLKAQDKFSQNTQIIAFLADAYTQMGETEKAIALVEELVEKNPENPQYHLSLGSRILISSSKLQNKLEENVNTIFELQRNGGEQAQQKIQALKQENKQLISKIKQLQDRAEEQFMAVLKYRPNDATAYNNLGVIYQNRAAIYYDLRNMTADRQQAKQYDTKADDLLKEAMKYYEKAVEIEPNNPDYWRKLYVVYTNLGLDKKANEAAQKAGIN